MFANNFSNALTIRKTEVAKTESKIAKIADTYDEHGKLVFIFDVSGSMASNIADTHYDGSKPDSRISLVKQMGKTALSSRFEKYPDSHVAVIEFGEGHSVVFDEGTQEDLWPKLEQLNAHGIHANNTDIMGALRGALEVCRKNPSPVGVHHFILVSDGGDGGTTAIGSWIPSLKASGVTLDYIHIGDSGSANEPLRSACEKLGGKMEVVDSVEAFKEKFLAAAQRPMLPPPA